MKAEIISILIMSLLTAYGHLIIKYCSSSFIFSLNPLTMLKQFLKPLLFTGITAVLAAPLFYFFALKSMKLNTAYSFTAFNQIMIPLLSIIIFKEKMSVKKITAVFLIAAGILIWNI